MSDCIDWIRQDAGRDPTWGEIARTFGSRDKCIEPVAGMTCDVDSVNKMCGYASRQWELIAIDSDGIKMAKSGFASLSISLQ